MSIFTVFLITMSALLPLTRQETFSPENSQDVAQDFLSFEGSLIHIKESNITAVACNCEDFRIYLREKTRSSTYHPESKLHECYKYEIVSTPEKVQVVCNLTLVKIADGPLDSVTFKCVSNDAFWKISKVCRNGSETHPCHVDCIHPDCRKNDGQLDVNPDHVTRSPALNRNITKNEGQHSEASSIVFIIVAVLVVPPMIYCVRKYVQYKIERQERKIPQPFEV
ncbi:uncharacterized protein LOC135138138 isoform X1 [Zophobas morio]|uniref:uncharacterized protein LOC135138138 isoform X1 n=1 Tax=Zophobas morio TaxID=2755281 RepID=UPI00308283E6